MIPIAMVLKPDTQKRVPCILESGKVLINACPRRPTIRLPRPFGQRTGSVDEPRWSRSRQTPNGILNPSSDRQGWCRVRAAMGSRNQEAVMQAWVGIDVAKASLEVVVLREQDTQATTLPNTKAGFRTLDNFLKKR